MRKNRTVFKCTSELRQAFGLPTFTRRTKDKKKLSAQRERLLGKCRACNTQMAFIKGTNVIHCANEDCKGFGRHGESTKKPGVFRLLDLKGAEIADTILD